MYGIEKVDILDSFCPFCSSNQTTFLGTNDELNKYWNKEWDDSFLV